VHPRLLLQRHVVCLAQKQNRVCVYFTIIRLGLPYLEKQMKTALTSSAAHVRGTVENTSTQSPQKRARRCLKAGLILRHCIVSTRSAPSRECFKGFNRCGGKEEEEPTAKRRTLNAYCHLRVVATLAIYMRDVTGT